MEFTAFNKIPRLTRECTITEKIDGTNGSVCIGENGEFLIGSRTQWITPERDNHGFARWVMEHKDELLKLGVGQHFGEWWGSGIQRGYGLSKGEKRFSLFNTRRWAVQGVELKQYPTADPNVFKSQEYCPSCCLVVPILYEGMFNELAINNALNTLQVGGSKASQGFMRPEGIVVWHTGARIYFKKTIEKDEEWKGCDSCY